MTTSPDLGIPFIDQQQAQPEVTHNEALLLLQAVLNGVISVGLNTPAVGPTIGDSYVLGAAPTGTWSGRANCIAIWSGTAWDFIPGETSAGTPITMGARQEGLRVWNKALDRMYVWTGSEWVQAIAIATVASATTTDIGAVGAETVSISGTTTITGLGTIGSGTFRRMHFQGVLTITHNGTSLILPGSANITTAAGDVAQMVSLGSGNWRCTGYMRGSVAP